MSKQLLRRWIGRSLPTLQQGSTLSIRSRLPRTNLSIRSDWRDDGHLSLSQQLQATDCESRAANLLISQEADRRTSLGRDERHVSVEVVPNENGMDDSGNGENPEKVVIFDDGRMLPDSEEWENPSGGLKRFQHNDYVTFIDKEGAANDDKISLAVQVPEKINIECDLSEGGSISIHNKIEGDVRLFTKDGNIVVKKLRGHVLDIAAQGPGNSMFSADLLEAQTLNISLPSDSSRFRAKRIHASNSNITLGSDNDISNIIPRPETELLDEDDGGAMCDVSSLYTTGDAVITVKTANDSRQVVRVKSHHGHVVVEAQAPKLVGVNALSGNRLPVVDMGGINGSCEVYVQNLHSTEPPEREDCDERWVSCRAHFDSISPDSVTVLRADFGDVHATIDRKVESDMRFLSASNLDQVNVDDLVIDQEEDEDYAKLQEMLSEVDQCNNRVHDSLERRIHIYTKAFTENESDPNLQVQNFEFVDGWVENNSFEPDSRFDRKLRGDTGSVGKIRLDGAAGQALHGFGQNTDDDSKKSFFLRPIVAIVSTGEIVLETLSWLGNIARRYGLEDKRDASDLGRTATRRGRPLD